MLYAMELLERWYAKVDVQGEDDCWEWTARRSRQGYGQFVHPETRLAHRAGYLLLVGPIPEGLQLDHLCRNTSCVNPKHLEPVTAAENIKRAYATKSCPGDHEPRWGERKVGEGRARYCLECQKDRARKLREDKAYKEVERQRTAAWRERMTVEERRAYWREEYYRRRDRASVVPIQTGSPHNGDITETQLGTAAERDSASDRQSQDQGTMATSAL